ncbi:17368_t:CDS:2, partial [Gigaspora margarita]
VFEKILLTNEFSDLENIKLCQSDWVSLENIAAFLKRFAKLSTEMSSNKKDKVYFNVAKDFNSYDKLNYYLESSPKPSTTDVLKCAPVERIFSESGNIITSECNRLGSGTIKALICLKKKTEGAGDYAKIRIIRVLRVIDSGEQDKLLVVDSNESELKWHIFWLLHTFTVVSVATNFTIGVFWISRCLREFHVGAI